MHSKRGAGAVHAALLEASRRLAQPGCARIFSEYADASGRKLQDNLDALGQTGAGYLGLIVFVDGYGLARCTAPGILAVTVPGSRVVHVCPQFAWKQLREPAAGQAVLIHEALHSLGLRENPPSSREITARVFARCGH